MSGLHLNLSKIDDFLAWSGKGVDLFSGKSCRMTLSGSSGGNFQWNKFRLAKWYLAKFPNDNIQADLLVGDPVLADNISVKTSKKKRDLCWTPPEFFKFNVDGTVRGDGMQGGIGGILRDPNASTLITFSTVVEPGPPTFAELKAIKEGIDLYLSSEWVLKGRLILESDCKIAVDWILRPVTAPSFFSSLVGEIGALVSARDIMITLIPRTCNWEADKYTFPPSANCPSQDATMREPCIEENVGEELPSIRVQVDLSPRRDVELSVNVMLQSLEVTYETTFFQDLTEFFIVIKYFEFQHERHASVLFKHFQFLKISSAVSAVLFFICFLSGLVKYVSLVLSSLNGIEDVKSRLLAKAECILSSHKKVGWDVNISNVKINFPSGNAASEEFNMIFELGSFVLASKTKDTLSSSIDGESHIQKNLVDSASISDWLTSCQLEDLYNHFEIKLVDFEVKLTRSNYLHTTSIVEKFCACITFASCIIPDESSLKQFEVYVSVESLDANFSLSIYESVVSLIVLNRQCSRSEPVVLSNTNSIHSVASQPGDPPFSLTLTANINSAKLLVDLANDGEHSSSIVLALRALDVWYSLLEYETCQVSLKGMKVTAHTSGETNNYILCSSGDLYPSNTVNSMSIKLGNASDSLCHENTTTETCFLLYYEAIGSIDFISHKLTVDLNDADLHCYPCIFGLLAGFYDRICSFSACIGAENTSGPTFEAKSTKDMPGFQYQRFGFSNYSEIGASDDTSISMDCFPFVTIYNYSSLGSLESSLRFSVPDWKKSFNLRDNKLSSTNCTLKKGSNQFHSSPLKSNMVTFPLSESSPDASIYAIDINLSGFKLHFHDSSCIVGTITLPTSKSSLSIYDDGMDLVSSSGGVILTSACWTNNCQNFLWGPSSPDLYPILNICVKQRNFGSLSSQLEVRFGIQHTCCVLPFNYLAIIVGYFSLHDWSSNSSVQSKSKSVECMDNQSEIAFICKFEILESTLIIPIISDDHQFLRTDIQRLYGSFMKHCVLSEVLKDIPPECVVPENKIARSNNCLNIFGRGLSLSLLLFEDDCITFIPGTKPRNFPLMTPFSADFWIRIPSELECLSANYSAYTCIMSRIGDCQFFIDDFYFFDGLEALLEIIDQFSLLHDESKAYTSDALQFLRSRRLQKENRAVSLVESSLTFIEVRCYVESLLIKLNRLGKDTLEPVAKAEMNFICSMSLINEMHMNLVLNFFSLKLSSLPNSDILARCSDTSSTTSVLDLSFSKSDPYQNDFCICLPSLNIWLHCSDWTEVLDLFYTYGQKLTKTTKLDSLPGSSAMNRTHPSHNASEHVPQISDKVLSASSNVPLSMMQKTVLILRSENIGITVYFPMHVSGEITEVVFTEEGWQNVSSTGTKGKHCKLLTFTTHCKSTELIISGKNAKFKCILGKTSGSVGSQGDDNANYLPLFHIFQVNVDTEICNIHKKAVQANLGIQCDHLDIWLSHQIFFFLRDVRFDVPGSRSQYNFGSMEFKIQLRRGSLMLSDGRWSCSGPLLEILLRNLLLRASVTQNSMESAVACDLQVNYNNVHKVFWEPFLEPWKFEMEIIRKQELNALMDNSLITDVHLISAGHLNFNFTEPLIEGMSGIELEKGKVDGIS
ncbi:DNA/RNA polymerases superfamily protein [Hibiscus syriacus]|uniref:DNA/RNA polymerases superfamily protein n=1 Tax=Hibiscus syriacus TaxID=106335 RepID=A0A6A3D959_HIBSY|nr:DNA/RNA polymerases superfamily protein [Hibiscus syriacus]